MLKRKINGFEISAVGLGCMGFSHAYGVPTEKKEAEKIIKSAYDIGYNYFDTAESYTGINTDGSISYNEELVGNALKSVRDKVFISTKFGISHNKDKSLSTDSSPKSIKKAVEGSLKRLNTDYIDLYYQHRTDSKVSPEVVASTMAELIKEGKIKSWGISEVNEDYLLRAHKVCPVSAIQNRYSIMARWHEKIFPIIEKLDIAFVAFSPLANGLLSGKYTFETVFDKKTDYRSFMPQFTKEGFEKSEVLLKLLKNMADEENATIGQIAIAWMLNKKPYIIPIPGSRKLERLKENLTAANIILSKEKTDEIDSISEKLNFLIFSGSKIK